MPPMAHLKDTIPRTEVHFPQGSCSNYFFRKDLRDEGQQKKSHPEQLSVVDWNIILSRDHYPDSMVANGSVRGNCGAVG